MCLPEAFASMSLLSRNLQTCIQGFSGDVGVKNPPANTGDTGDSGSIPDSGGLPGGRNGNPAQYFCLENPMDTGVWCAVVHGVTKSWTCLSD